MLSKNKIRFIRSLHLSKFRKEEGSFIAEGPKVVDELLKSHYKVELIAGTEEWMETASKLTGPGIEQIEVSTKDLERISTLKTPNQVLAVARQAPFFKQEKISTDELVLVLDSIRDPGNMGSIIRTADWFGIEHVVCSGDCVDLYNPKVIQATMGSFTRVQMLYADLMEFISAFAERTCVYGAVLEGKDLYHADLTPHGLLVIGNESNGISNHILPLLTHKISIPGFASKEDRQAESLNASVAAAILCSEFRRQNK